MIKSRYLHTKYTYLFRSDHFAENCTFIRILLKLDKKTNSIEKIMNDLLLLQDG